jgi:hypothetical protein
LKSVLEEPMPHEYYDYLVGFVEGRGPPQGAGSGGSSGAGSRTWGGGQQQGAGAGAGVQIGEPLVAAKAWHLDQLGIEGVYDMDASGPLVQQV